MKPLSLHCTTRGCCRDFSSHEQQKPSLADIHVVGKIIEQAAKNTTERWSLFQQGELSSSQLKEADRKLLVWLTDTFHGDNPHFRTDEAWNPNGLSRYLVEHFNGQLGGSSGALPQSEKEVIEAAMQIFLQELYGILQFNQNPQTFCRQYVVHWEMLLTGAPV